MNIKKEYDLDLHPTFERHEKIIELIDWILEKYKVSSQYIKEPTK